MASMPDPVRPAALPVAGKGLVIAFGAVTLVFGVLMLLLPWVTAVAATLMVGALLTIVGIAGIVVGAKSARPSRRGQDIVLGLLTLGLGLYALLAPVTAAISLALVAAVWLLARAVFEGSVAFRTDGRARSFLLLAALLDLVLGLLLLFNWPYPAVQLVGIAIGVSVLVSGLMTLIVGVELPARRT